MAEVTIRGGRSLAQEVLVRNHRIPADEPVEDGGTDTGANPYELLLAALGACTAMTVRLYADRKGWPLERVIVTLSHQKVHLRDAEQCEGRDDCVIDRIEKEISFLGELDETQRERLAYIASRCPVHRTLEGQISIEQRLREAAS